MDEKHIIALEIGSSKIKGAVGSVDSNGYVTVKAIEEMPLTDSVRHGQLSNVSMAANAVRTLLLKIENRLTPRKVEGIYHPYQAGRWPPYSVRPSAVCPPTPK